MQGRPLSIAVLGVEDLEASLAFYRDTIGLEASEVIAWEGEALEPWRSPRGGRARAVLLSHAGLPVGRILLAEFTGPRVRVRERQERRFVGLFNLNFYTRDIRAAARRLEASGFTLWSEPVQYDLSPEVGSPIEMVFEAPDAVPINLVELAGGGEGTRIGEMRRFLETQGATRTGFTPVVTSAHCVRDREAALAFYDRVLGMESLIDEVMDKPESNRFLNLPAGAATRVTFLKGNHLFGKVALTQPLNYRVPDLVERAIPPNVGYLAMGFLVPDLSAAERRCREVAAEVWGPPSLLLLPGIGPRRALTVRTPGSGALTQLIEEQV